MVIMANRKHGNTPLKVGLYDIGEEIGKGNFATVRFARHRHTKSDVAIKIIDKTKLSKSDLDKVNREIEIMRLLSHPHIIKLYQVMKTENMLYLVTEYAPNGEIFDYIVKNGKLSEPEARKKFWQILSAIEYCHNSRVVHRDLKAENLLLDANGNIKIADFGFGNKFSEDGHLATFCGSPPYAAPELFEGKTYRGPEVDIWSLGVVLYVLVCGGLPFYGENLRDLKDRVVKGMYRIPYWMSEDCVHLIRRMLVRDPDKRYTIEQIKKHRWLLADGPLKQIHSFKPVNRCGVVENGVSNNQEEYNEHVLRLMDQIGMERQKTIEQLNKNNVYDHYTAIYHLLLDRTRLHRSSYPLEKHADPRHQRRPSTVADNALYNMSKYLQQSQFPQPNIQHNQDSDNLGVHPTIHSHYAPCVTQSNIDYTMSGGHIPLTSTPSYTPSIDTTYSTSAESGLEVDMETSDFSSPPTLEIVGSKPPLARRHTLTGMTGIPSAEYMLRSVGGPSIDSGHSMELPSESQSIESNLDSECVDFNSAPGSSPFSNYTTTSHQFSNSFAHNQEGVHMTSSLGIRQHTNGEQSMQMDHYGRQRQTNRSPVNFREGRRASDGIVCKDVIAFRQKLKDDMKAGGMLELRQEHNQLLESHSGEIDTSNSSLPHTEPVIKPPLGKRMSLPTNSIDLPPHRLLEIKKSIQIDSQLAGSQEVHEITHPFGPLRPYEPMQIHPFSNPPSLQRQVHTRALRKQVYKQQSALHQQFQQMHIEQNNLITAPIPNFGRHPPLARQPSYKMAQQQTVMPQVLHNSDMVAPLPWEPTAENSNFLLQIANTCTLTTCTTSIMSSSTTMSMSATSTHQQHLSPHPYPPHNQEMYFNPPAQ